MELPLFLDNIAPAIRKHSIINNDRSKVPALAESITEVTLSRWLVKDGDYVALDQPLCEFETDKASQELPSPAAGVIKLIAKDGDDLKIGALICNIDESAAKPAEEKRQKRKLKSRKRRT